MSERIPKLSEERRMVLEELLQENRDRRREIQQEWEDGETETGEAIERDWELAREALEIIRELYL